MVILPRGTIMIFSGLLIFIVLFEGSDVTARSLDPEFMTLEDAKYYMDATATSESHEFEVVSPWEIDSSRKKRDAENPFGMSEFKFNAFGEEFHLQLTTNHQLTRRGLKVQYVDSDGNVEERPLPAEHEDCYKFGRVLSHEGASRVAVSTCNNGLSGIVKLDSFELFIQKLTDNHTESVRRKRRDLENPHIVYRRSADNEESDDEETGNNSTHYCGLERFYHYMDSSLEMDLHISDDEEAAPAGRRKREATCSNGTPVGTKIFELLVVIDSEMENYHTSFGRSATEYALTLMNTVASSYLHDSLGIPLVIKIVQLRILQSTSTVYGGNNVLSVSPNGGTTLESFCRYQSSLNSNNENDPDHYDNAVLLSRYNLELEGNNNLLGIAQFNGACFKDRSCALIEESGFGSGVVITHELGHNLGMEHDGETRFSGAAASCTNGVNIMSSSRTNGPNSFIWSSCSRDQLNTFLCQPWNTCLNDNLSNGNSHPLVPSDMPGVRYTGAQQCLLINSQTSGVCVRHDNICGHLACMFPNGQCIGTGVAALDGTDCGSGKWCVEGICVNQQSSNPAVNGGWSVWSVGQCSVTCGQGFQTRTRQCNNPVPQNGGQACVGSTTDTITCFQQACFTPINGGWSSWQSGTCSVSCGGGQMLQTRICNNPLPQNGGANCFGNNVQTVSCNTQACPNRVDGGWSDWTYGPCSTSCGGGQQTLTRSCNNPVPQNGGTYCSGNSFQVNSCNTQACPVVVHGGWSEWTYYACSQSCGGGTQTRIRTCTNPVPQNGGSACSGASYETQISCNTQACIVNGGWTNWGAYGPCSVTCGSSGQKTRSRSCTNPIPQNGGQTCSGSSIEYQPCSNSQACVVPVNGGWSPWQPFGPCSVSCGGGQKTRTRSCTNPSPQNGGQPCVGSEIDSQSCNTESCVPSSGQVVSGAFTGGQYGEYVVFLTIPVGATSVDISNQNAITHMAIKHGNTFVLGEVVGNTLPPRTITQLTYQGVIIIHDFTNSQVETITIDGPTTVELIASVHVILDPSSFGSQVYPDITWSYQAPGTTNTEYQWVTTEGSCSVSCGPGVRIEVIRCALLANQQQVFSDDENLCSHLPKPTAYVVSCNEATCPSDQTASWFVGQLDCSGLCGQTSGHRGVYCIATSGPSFWQIVDEANCSHQPKPSETAECTNLQPCALVPQEVCVNTVVTSEGSINRMSTPTAGDVCGYTIVAPAGMAISIQLIKYDIDCSQGEELIFKDAHLKSDLCTRAVDPGTSKVSQSNVVQIEHKTTLAGHGYHITYSFVSKSQPSDCDEIFLDDSGSIQSPRFPGNYPNNQLCRKYIIAPADMKIVVTFSTLSLYNRCWRFAPKFYDYLTVQDYDEDTYRWFCGTFTDPSQLTYTSTSNRVQLTFRSDGLYSGQGFQASYSFVPSG